MSKFRYLDELNDAVAKLRSTADMPARDPVRAHTAQLLEKVLDELDAIPRYVRGTLASVDFEAGDEGEMVLHVKTPAGVLVLGDVEWRMVPFNRKELTDDG